MTINKEQLDHIKALVASKQPEKIEQAKQILRQSSDPRAADLLTKLTARYPDQMPSKSTQTAVDPLAEANDLIRQQRFDEAEAALWDANTPEALALLEKIATVRTAAAGDVSKSKTKTKPRSAQSQYRHNILIAIAFSLCLVCGVIASIMATFPPKELEMARAIEPVCRDFFEDDYAMILTEIDFEVACLRESKEMVANYKLIVEPCYDAWGTTTYKLIKCIADGGARFSGNYMRAAKE